MEKERLNKNGKTKKNWTVKNLGSKTKKSQSKKNRIFKRQQIFYSMRSWLVWCAAIRLVAMQLSWPKQKIIKQGKQDQIPAKVPMVMCKRAKAWSCYYNAQGERELGAIGWEQKRKRANVELNFKIIFFKWNFWQICKRNSQSLSSQSLIWVQIFHFSIAFIKRIKFQSLFFN